MSHFPQQDGDAALIQKSHDPQNVPLNLKRVLASLIQVGNERVFFFLT